MWSRLVGSYQLMCAFYVLAIFLLPWLYEWRMQGGLVRMDYYLLWGLGILSWLFTWLKNVLPEPKYIFPVLLLFGYLSFSVFRVYPDDGSLQVPITLFCCLGIFSFLSAFLPKISFWLQSVLIASCAVQVLIAFGQLSQHGSNTILVRGQFYNSGYLGNYLAALVPLIFFNAFRNEGNARMTRIICLMLLAAGVFLLFRVAARAAIVGSLFGCLTSAVFLYKKRFGFSITRLVLLFSILFLLTVGISLLVKINSAMGRLTIYKISWQVFRDHFLFGVGPNRFAAVYNNYQSSYFRYGQKPLEIEMLATNTLEAFNIPMQFLVEYGLAGLIVLAGVVFFIRRNLKNDSLFSISLQSGAGHIGCLAAIFISGLFSNPIHISPIQLLTTIHLAAIFSSGDTCNKPVRMPGYVSALSLGMLLLLVGIYSCRQLDAEWTWRKAARSALYDGFEEAKEGYMAAAKALGANGAFLFNYGAEAAIAGELLIANEFLEKSRRYLSVNNIYVYLGDVYLEQGLFEKAEQNYLHAVFMVPSAIYPKYKLIECYKRMGNIILARKWSEQLLNYPVKVRSAVADELRSEVRNNLDNL
ncbi:O-antigen ligase family protein [Flavihumibacter stibioxidans]|uniref:O-antigen ligase-related domain-containing protein n=1 Tax=Flavihumibacter stibioxidans TaxID=1834163 RepID=A0ABR7M5J2_9BACT|nr:O-antigen ligase family protein [Flavihumibacter stibioxidans]MBC6490279.1 hypothetical protein [Flavihumibacter stibioxidans]